MNDLSEAATENLAAAESAGGLVLLKSLMDTGGPVLLCLLILSMVATAILLLKVWQMRGLRERDRVKTRKLLSQFKKGNGSQACHLARNAGYPASRILAFVIEGLHQGVSEDRLREAVYCYSDDLLNALRSNIRTLEVIAVIAPLLGLLGTVIGMIDAFQQLEAAGNRVDPSVLSSGIWEALLTTAAGLTVAIPVVVATTWLNQRLDTLSHEMDHVLEASLADRSVSSLASLGVDEFASHASAI